MRRTRNLGSEHGNVPHEDRVITEDLLGRLHEPPGLVKVEVRQAKATEVARHLEGNPKRLSLGIGPECRRELLDKTLGAHRLGKNDVILALEGHRDELFFTVKSLVERRVTGQRPHLNVY